MGVMYRCKKNLLFSQGINNIHYSNVYSILQEADSETDAGDYKVVATNELGSATHGARVTVDVEKV